MKVNILEAKNRLSELVRAAAAGEEVVIANRGRAVARLVGAEGLPATVAADQPAADRRFAVHLAEIDRIPDRADAFDPLEWDERGLQR